MWVLVSPAPGVQCMPRRALSIRQPSCRQTILAVQGSVPIQLVCPHPHPQVLLQPETKAAARQLSYLLLAEDGAQGTADMCHHHMRECGLLAPAGMQFDELRRLLVPQGSSAAAERAKVVAAAGAKEWQRLRWELAKRSWFS